MSEPLTDEELAELEALTAAAKPGPWIANIEDEAPVGGDSMIELGLAGDFPPDMYVFHDREIAPSAEIKFIAAARNYMPRLLADCADSGVIREHWPRRDNEHTVTERLSFGRRTSYNV